MFVDNFTGTIISPVSCGEFVSLRRFKNIYERPVWNVIAVETRSSRTIYQRMKRSVSFWIVYLRSRTRQFANLQIECTYSYDNYVRYVSIPFGAQLFNFRFVLLLDNYCLIFTQYFNIEYLNTVYIACNHYMVVPCI